MLKKYARIVMAGDSVTDCGRARPVGCRNTGIGNGYAFFVDTALSALYPEQKIWIDNMGIGGDTSMGLLTRYDDILDRKPDVVTMLIGINNIWAHFDIRSNFPDDVKLLSPEHYESHLRKMIESTLNNGTKMILITPFFLEPNKNDPLRNLSDKYGAIVKKLADEYDTYFCDVQSVFDEFMTKESSYLLSNDRVHPNSAGHYIIANEVLKVLETVEL